MKTRDAKQHKRNEKWMTMKWKDDDGDGGGCGGVGGDGWKVVLNPEPLLVFKKRRFDNKVLFECVRLSAVRTNELKMCVYFHEEYSLNLYFCIVAMHSNVPARTLLFVQCYIIVVVSFYFFQRISIVCSPLKHISPKLSLFILDNMRLHVGFFPFVFNSFCYFVVCSFSHLNFFGCARKFFRTYAPN